MVDSFLDNKTGLGRRVSEWLVQELRKIGIKDFKRRKVHVGFKVNIWAVDLSEMT